MLGGPSIDLAMFEQFERIKNIGLVHLGNRADSPLSWAKVSRFLRIHKPVTLHIETCNIRGIPGDTKDNQLPALHALSLVDPKGDSHSAILSFPDVTSLNITPSPTILSACVDLLRLESLTLTNPSVELNCTPSPLGSALPAKPTNLNTRSQMTN